MFICAFFVTTLPRRHRRGTSSSRHPQYDYRLRALVLCCVSPHLATTRTLLLQPFTLFLSVFSLSPVASAHQCFAQAALFVNKYFGLGPHLSARFSSVLILLRSVSSRLGSSFRVIVASHTNGMWHLFFSLGALPISISWLVLMAGGS